MTFWIVTSFMALAIGLLIALVLLRTRTLAEPAAAFDLKVYRQQLRDVEKDLARGVINESDATRVRTEVSRRILNADAQLQDHHARQSQPRRLTWVMATVVAIALLGGSLGLYGRLGAVGYGDFALGDRIALAQERAENRPSQQAAESALPPRPALNVEAGYIQLVDQLRQTATQRANDAQGQALLAQHEANLGNFTAAYQAKQNYIRIMAGDIEANDHSEVAELMIMAAGGYVSPEAEVELRNALARDRRNGPSRFYWGLMLDQVGRPDMAYQIWSETLQMGPSGAAWIEGIEEQIAAVAFRAGVEHTPTAVPPAPAAAPLATPLAGPSAEDMANAQDMSSQDRQGMIRDMVNRLSDRLATDGGSPQEWARLIGALGVLGEPDQARAIHAEALQVFAADEAALALITGAAQQAGLLQ